MDTILKAFLILFAGCGVFIAGMNMLSENLEKKRRRRLEEIARAD